MMPGMAWSEVMIRSSYAALAGYAIMVLAFSMIFLAVSKYSQNSGVNVSFGKAFMIGLGISAMATLVYIIAWGFIDGFSGGEFIDRYEEGIITEMQAEGASTEEIQVVEKEMDAYREWYANPFLKMLLTSLEIFPVGVLVSLFTALVFRFRRKK